MKRSFKRILYSFSFISMLTLSAYGLETPFFSGYAGILGDFLGDKNETTTFKPDLQAQTFFEGQLDFSGNFLLKSEFYLSTANLLSKNIFEEPTENNAKFRIQEISATGKANALTFTNYFSFFLGNFEPIGSDIYLQRQFGIKSITSRITESWHGAAGASIYPFYGAGFSYTLRFEKPKVLGLNLYMNLSLADILEGLTSDDIDNAFNIDLRYACIYPYFAFDICGGLGLHIEKKDSAGEKVFILVKEVDVHGGLAMLIGNRYTSSVFLQAGIGEIKLTADSSNDFKLHNIYFLLEPRFVGKHTQWNFSIFNIPANAVSDMIYLKCFEPKQNLLGANISVHTENLYIGNKNITFGIHTTTGITDIKNVTELANFLSMIASFKINVTPYVSIPVFGGNFNSSLRIDALRVPTDPSHCFTLSCGFKTAL